MVDISIYIYGYIYIWYIVFMGFNKNHEYKHNLIYTIDLSTRTWGMTTTMTCSKAQRRQSAWRFVRALLGMSASPNAPNVAPRVLVIHRV